jgi:hypothetical protein
VVVVTWGVLRERRPELAEAGRELFYRVGVGLAYLATVRADGGPRVHPICPLLHGGALYGFIVPGPKRADLHRDGRYALHSFPTPDNEDAFSCTGWARLVVDAALRRTLAELFVKERAAIGVPEPGADQHLFVFDLERCLLTRTTGHGDPRPRHTVWRADEAPR